MVTTRNAVKRPLLIGLTGGIGAGKSTVAELFRELGVPVIDADDISRALVQPGSPLLEQIIAHFGENILNSDHTLNRLALRERIFNHPTEKQWLEKLLHPAIFDELQRQALAQAAPYVILVIPLLFESGRQDFVDRILVVDAPEAEQVSRAIVRDQVSVKQIEAIMQHQCSRAQRLLMANEVVENNEVLSVLRPQVVSLHKFYLHLISAL